MLSVSIGLFDTSTPPNTVEDFRYTSPHGEISCTVDILVK